MTGLKLRIPERDTIRAMAEARGTRPTLLNISGLYRALRQGADDGRQNRLATIQATSSTKCRSTWC